MSTTSSESRTTRIAHLMLCDHAQVADGKLFINGGGISRFSDPACLRARRWPCSCWFPGRNQRADHDRSATAHPGTVSRFAPGPRGSPIRIQVQTEVGRPPASSRSPDRSAPSPSREGCDCQPAGYTWQLSVDNQTRQPWQISFTVTNES